MYKKILFTLEYILIGFYGIAVFCTPFDEIIQVIPYIQILVHLIIVTALVCATVGYLRKPSVQLPTIWVLALSVTTFYAIHCYPSNGPVSLSPLALLVMAVVGLLGRNYVWIITFLIFTLGETVRTIALLLINRLPITMEVIGENTLRDPFHYLYLLLAGFLPSLLSASFRMDRQTSNKAALPPDIGQFLSAESSSSVTGVNTKTFTLEHLSDYHQSGDERDVSDLLSSVVYFMSRNFRAYSSLGFIYDPKEQAFNLNSSQSKSLNVIKNVSIPQGSGVVGRIASEKRSFMTGDLRVYNKELLYYSSEEQINSIIAVPIISEQSELLGTLVLDSKDTHAFKDQDKEILKRFSSLAAALITTARMRSFQERSAKTFQTFYQASHQFTTALEVEHVFEVLCNVIPTVVKSTRQIGIVFDEENSVGKVLTVCGTSSDIQKGFSFAINSGLYSFAFQKRRPVVIGDYRQFIDRYYRFVPNEVKSADIRSLIIFPILDDEQRCRGLYSIESSEANIFFADIEQILTTLIENASVAFIRSILYRRMERLATTDGLTGLNNHRHFQELLAQEIERSRRYRRPLALLIMDIDHFKSFNDTYGHPVGDLVLKEISQCIRKSIRRNDIPARYGGEEFVVIIPETTENGAITTAERIRTTIEQHTIISLERKLKVTVSLGCSAFPENAPSQQALIDTADKALYVAKESGRNRVVLYKAGMDKSNRK